MGGGDNEKTIPLWLSHQAEKRKQQQRVSDTKENKSEKFSSRQMVVLSRQTFNPCPAEPGYTLPLQTV